jgi:hypothetical protein
MEQNLRLKVTNIKMDVPTIISGHKQLHFSHWTSTYRNMKSIVVLLHLTDNTEKLVSF